jgi:hypothetical protein
MNIFAYILISLITIINTTNKDLDPFIETGLGLLHIEEVHVTVAELPEHLKGDMRAYVDKNQWDDMYYLYVDTSLRDSKIYRAVAHELVHIQQYEQNRLERTENGYKYEGKHYHASTYDRRSAWESEAFSKEYRFMRKIQDELHKHEASTDN